MKNLICLFALLLFSSSAFAQQPHPPAPKVDIPHPLWQKNWNGGTGGSCVHASAIMLWRWQGQYAWAEYWKSKYGSGEYAERFHRRCDAEGVTYCDTWGEKDYSLLVWAVSTRRGCLVGISNGQLYGYGGRIAHAVCLVHLDSQWAGILDNNDVGQGAGNVTWV